jgi:hypothetical protein
MLSRYRAGVDLSGLRPSELALRDWVRPRMSAELVEDLARRDHGMLVDEHREAIEDLLTAGRLPTELGWPPREALELAGHGDVPVVRLFACLVLVRAGDLLRPSATVAGLVESALVLGPEATEAAMRYLAWCRLHERDDEVRPFLTLGLLLVYRAMPGPADQSLADGLAAAFAAEADTVPAREWRLWRRLVDEAGQPVRLA